MPHPRDGFIVARVGIERSETAFSPTAAERPQNNQTTCHPSAKREDLLFISALSLAQKQSFRPEAAHLAAAVEKSAFNLCLSRLHQIP